MIIHKRFLFLSLISILCFQLPLYAFDNGATQSLIKGIKEGNASKVKKSIEQGADINAQIVGENKETPLMLAIREYVLAYQEHTKYTNPWTLSTIGSIAGFGAGMAGLVKSSRDLDDTTANISIATVAASLLTLIASTILSDVISVHSKRSSIVIMLLDNPQIDVSMQNSNGENVLMILNSYASVLKTSKLGSKTYKGFKKRIEETSA